GIFFDPRWRRRPGGAGASSHTLDRAFDFFKGASLRCAPAFGRAEEVFLTRLPRAYVLGYRYTAPTGLFLRSRQHFPHTQDYLETRATGLIASLDGFAGGGRSQVGADGGFAV